jgi:hypothetical protein
VNEVIQQYVAKASDEQLRRWWSSNDAIADYAKAELQYRADQESAKIALEDMWARAATNNE